MGSVTAQGSDHGSRRHAAAQAIPCANGPSNESMLEPMPGPRRGAILLVLMAFCGACQRVPRDSGDKDLPTPLDELRTHDDETWGRTYGAPVDLGPAAPP